MGANLSGTYGDVLVHDTIDTIFFAPKGSSLKAVISDILLSTVVGLSSLGILAAFIPYFAATFWIFGVCIALSIIVAIIWNASRPTLLLRFPEHTWVMEKVFPTHQRIAEGNTFPWKEVMVMEVSATDVIASWHLTLTCKPSRIFDYKLESGREDEARAFAEELGSRLGIPVVDEPEYCKEIMENIVTEVKKITKAASSWMRLGSRKG